MIRHKPFFQSLITATKKVDIINKRQVEIKIVKGMRWTNKIDAISSFCYRCSRNTYTLNHQTHTHTDWTSRESNQTNKIFFEKRKKSKFLTKDRKEYGERLYRIDCIVKLAKDHSKWRWHLLNYNFFSN